MSNTDLIKNFNNFRKSFNQIIKRIKLDKIFWFKLINSCITGVAFGFVIYTGLIAFLM